MNELEALGFDLSDCHVTENVTPRTSMGSDRQLDNLVNELVTPRTSDKKVLAGDKKVTPRTSGLKQWFSSASVVLAVIGAGLGIGGTVRVMEKAAAIAAEPAPIVTPTVNVSSEPKLLKITVNVSTPEDLKVKTGDIVKKDQVIADRDKERDRLLVQKSGITNSIARLEIPAIAPLPPRAVPKIPDLPPITYAEEAAQINNHIIKVKAVEEKVKLQQIKLSVLQTLDEKDAPPAIQTHEEQVLIKLQADLEQAKSEQELYFNRE